MMVLYFFYIFPYFFMKNFIFVLFALFIFGNFSFAIDIYQPSTSDTVLLGKMETIVNNIKINNPNKLDNLEKVLIDKIFNMPSPQNRQQQQVLYVFKKLLDTIYLANTDNEIDRMFRKVEYCKKFFPTTISTKTTNNENIDLWYNANSKVFASNPNTKVVTTYNCLWQ